MARRRHGYIFEGPPIPASPMPPVEPPITAFESPVFKSVYLPAVNNTADYLTVADIESVLSQTIDDPLGRWEPWAQQWNIGEPSLTRALPPQPIPPIYKVVPPAEPEPDWAAYMPSPPAGFLRTAINSLTKSYDRKFDDARKRYELMLTAWRMREEPRLSAIRENEARKQRYDAEIARNEVLKSELTRLLEDTTKKYRDDRDAFLQAQREEAEMLHRATNGAGIGDPDAIRELTTLVLLRSPYHKLFPRTIDSLYDPGSRLLVAELEIPSLDLLPVRDVLKTKTKPVADKAKRRLQELLLYVMPLRLLHELFSTTALSLVDMISVNATASYIDRRDGQTKFGILSSIAVRRDDFRRIVVRTVDPKTCFRELKGRAVPSIEMINPVPPLIHFDRSDRRFVVANDVLDNMDQATNLAAMDWEDFEHLVRELFGKEFAARSPGAEVNITRASRDYGVDAIIFDPDPIHGGKRVIQAKRYTRTVDVAAVRDLYGTMLNEGADRGILVTTSTFGSDSREFAKAKPITLIDGANLLALLEKHGYHFSIDVVAARAMRSHDE